MTEQEFKDRWGFTVDQLGGVQFLPVEALAAVARGELDLNQLAIHHLANHGLDKDLRFVGYTAARRQLLGDQV